MITDRITAAEVTPQDILDLVSSKQRELNELEFKSQMVPENDLLKEACAIANFGGGFLLIGIAEDANHRASAVVNVPKVRSAVESIRQTLRDGLSPRPVIEVVHLAVSADDIIVVRLAPQNPPHMVARDKHTDFWNRYDTTSERMRYEEIEQRFRDKHQTPEDLVSETPKATVESIGGRTTVTQGAKGVLDTYLERLRETVEPTFALVAVCDGLQGTGIDEEAALSMFGSPIYLRQGGWLVINPKTKVVRREGLWEQVLGGVSTTTVSPSGDLVFVKSIDNVLSHQQSEADFNRSPRVYPNAVVEYCLSFGYAVAAVATRALPAQILMVPVMTRAKGVNLPLGEGGSVWFDAPLEAPKILKTDHARGRAVPITVESQRPILVRHAAFLLAAQVYGMFGYLERQVPFVLDGEIIIESSRLDATLTSIRSYLQNVFELPFGPPQQEIMRGVYWFGAEVYNRSYRIGVSREFAEDQPGSEAKLFSRLDKFILIKAAQKFQGDAFIVITNEGLKTVRA